MTMNAHLASSTPPRPALATESVPAPSPALRRAILISLAACAGLATVGLGITTFTPATAVFPILVWTIFTAL
jgi:hypothetical protein